jgi:hypothetical protein
MIWEIEEEPEPNIFNFNMLEVSWVESVSTKDVEVEVEAEMEFELELEEEDDNEDDDEEEDNEEENDERSTKLDFTNVDTKDKLAAPSPSSGVVEVDDVRENEVEGILDKTSPLVWGIEETIAGSAESDVERDWESEAGEEEARLENESGWILVRNIEFTESTGLWPVTSWPATNPVNSPNKFNKSSLPGEVDDASRAWIVATELSEPSTSDDRESYETSNDWAWFNDVDKTFNTVLLESRDNSDGERVTDDKEVRTDKTPPSLTSLSSEATLSNPTTIWERISRRSDISEEEIPQSSPE